MIANIIFLLGTAFSIYYGIKFGYTHSHTPPLPFVISSLLIILGVLLFFFRKIIFKEKINDTIHLVIIGVNLIIVLFCLLPTSM
ncbi:hypothetical protein M2372_001681 [Chryseobacterium sp. BIGb0232]|nr:hypothetical protein [Chryseobacterium sp. BIGb0232]ROS18186.1 hypothetical protein EDF65_2578 [Chryseobacterium nakagawai]